MVSFHNVPVFSYLIIKRIYSIFRFKRGGVLWSYLKVRLWTALSNDKTTRPTLIGIGVQHGLYTYKPQAEAVSSLSPLLNEIVQISLSGNIA